MPNQNIVGKQIRRLRTDARLSQDAFAARLQILGWDLSRAGLSKIEAGLRRVNDAELWLIAKAFGTNVGMMYPDSPDEVLSVIRQGRG
jgi:transcriptional regulator with XRE-family HTH domain